MSLTSSCFFCTTPFQIIAATCIAESLTQEIIDIYIVEQFSGASELVPGLNKLGIYNQILLVDEEKLRNRLFGKYDINYFDAINSYFAIELIAKEIQIIDKSYNKVYVSTTTSFTPRWAYLYFYKKKMPIELIFFDDGCGSYLNPDYCYGINKIDQLIRIFLFGKESIRGDRKLLLYSPELFLELNNNSYFKDVNAIPKDSIKSIINAIFNLPSDFYISEKVVFFDTVHSESYELEKDVGFAIIHNIFDVFKKTDILIKRHPRDKSKMREEFRYYKYSSLPMESLCSSIDFSKKLIISDVSTSAVTPKLLFHQEPFVILLYKIIPGKKINPKLDQFFSSFINLYSERKFFIPDSIDEFKELLKNIKDKIV